jgi:protein-tyrosine phosphatase
MSAAHARVIFVCTGNICRSPTAEGIFLHKVARAGLSHLIEVDSAGTHGYHIGEAPDERSVKHAGRRGYDLSALRARRFAKDDFHRFDLVLAMDAGHHEHLSRLMQPSNGHKLKMMLEYSPRFRSQREVPDPYYGGPEGFEQVLDMLEDAADGLLRELGGRTRGVGHAGV